MTRAADGAGRADRRASSEAARDLAGVDIVRVAHCLCLGLRRTARAATQLYDAHLGPSGLSVGQFGVMAQIQGAALWRQPFSIKELAAEVGMDPTTLNRTLRPLLAQGLVASAVDDHDQRTRRVTLTPIGLDKLTDAIGLWDAADRAARSALGDREAQTLEQELRLASDRLRDLS